MRKCTGFEGGHRHPAHSGYTGEEVTTMPIELRDYQRRAVRGVLSEFGRGRRPLVVSAAGSGKSHVATELARRLSADGLSVLLVSHRREILRQLADSAVAVGVPPEDLAALYPGSPFPEYDGQPVLVASHPLLARRRELPPADVLLVDEAHRVAARTYARLVSSYPGVRVAGFTATPVRLDGKPLGAHFDSMVVAERTGRLVRDGFLGSPVCFVAKEEFQPDLAGLQLLRGDWQPGKLRARVLRRGIVGNVVDAFRRRVPADGTGVVFAVSVEHAERLARRFLNAGVSSEVITARTSISERDGLRDRLRGGETRVVVNVGVLSEGFDFPEVNAVVLARPTCSLTLYLQQVGRAMRPRSDGLRTIVLDHARNVLRFGLPEAERTFTLEFGAHQLPEENLPRVCPECGAAVPRRDRICSFCGVELPSIERISVPREERGIPLVELTAKMKAEIRGKLRSFLAARGDNDEAWIDSVITVWEDAQA